MIGRILGAQNVYQPNKAATARKPSNARQDIYSISDEEYSIVVNHSLPDYDFFEDPDIFTTTGTEKSKFINDALYADDKRLLQVLINTLAKTTTGKSMCNACGILQEQGKIVFEPHSQALGAKGQFGILKESNDPLGILIIIAKDNHIDNLAMTLTHEITHFMDYYNCVKKRMQTTRLDMESKAFANAYKVMIELNKAESFGYVMLHEKNKQALLACYEHHFTDKKYTVSQINDLLTDVGYNELSELLVFYE